MQKNYLNNNFKNSGVALVAVLAVLVILTILASTFVAFTSMEQKSSEASINKFQAEIFAQSGVEHALSYLWIDSVVSPAWDCPQEPWNKAFRPSAKNLKNATDVDRIKSKHEKPLDANWNYIHNQKGEIVGRYAVIVQDEAGKINLNSASALSEKMQNEGCGTSEILLTDGKKRGLPFKISFAKNILKYRYGKDRAPGKRNYDDNLTESAYATDRIDNNANGIVDEPDEGIDEPGEYNSTNLRWDDRSFLSVNDVVSFCAKKEDPDINSYRYLKKFATVNSKSSDVFWDKNKNCFIPRININVAAKKQLNKVLSSANSKKRFVAPGKNLRKFVANIADYRDENNVLTTLGSQYGVEAICFNEVMANDGSYSMEAEGNSPEWNGSMNKFAFRFGLWYNHKSHYKYGFPIKSIGGQGGSATVLTNGILVSIPHTTTVKLSREMISFPINQRAYKKFLEIRDFIGEFPDDLWKNSWLKVSVSKDYLYYPIIGNKGDILTIGYNSVEEYDKLVDAKEIGNNSAKIDNLWRSGAATWCVFPEMNDYWALPTKYTDEINPKPNQYYYVYIGEQSFGGEIKPEKEFPFSNSLNDNDTPWKGYNNRLDVDGVPEYYSESKMITLTKKDLKGTTIKMPDGKNKKEMLRWAYKDGKLVRAKGGYIHLAISTCKQTGYVGGMNETADLDAFKQKNAVDVAYIMRPDIVELINISDKPVSLKNWKVVINTGSYADQVGLIESAIHYSSVTHGKYEDPNPSIPPKGYFYLTNKRDIFALEYGNNERGVWGGSRNHLYHCFELPDNLWGVRYEISAVADNKLSVKNARWKDGQMKYEMIEIHSPKSYPDRNGPTGIRKSLDQSGRNWLKVGTNVQLDKGDGVKPGDDLLILGMPRQGGFLSMTLKNEYDQIAARIIDYGNVEIADLNSSTEKIDPTQYSWKTVRNPSFGGTEKKARNKSHSLNLLNAPHIKNNRLSSVGELQSVRSADNWKSLDSKDGNQTTKKVLQSLGNYFTVSGIRLDPEEKGVHKKGWNPAFGKIAYSKTENAVAQNVNWEPDIWKGHSLRVLTGELKGEKFPIIKSTENAARIDGFSTPGSKKLKLKTGDMFSVGPGYSTPLFYTRKNNDEGIWEWKNQNLEKKNYGLYLFGLNDSIRTSEFLEENRNAKLDVFVYNFKNKMFDNLCQNNKMFQYEKNDGVFCGEIKPENISPENGIKLKIVSHSLDDKFSSGFAWFDYAYLTPETVDGKININTASPRVISSLPGVSPEIAMNIYKRTGLGNKKASYENITDVLNVKNVTPKLYSKICNLIETRSDQFRIQVLAETLKDVDQDGKFNEKSGDKILAQARIDKIVDRSR